MLDGLTPDQLQTLTAGGWMTPQQAQQIQARSSSSTSYDGAGGTPPDGQAQQVAEAAGDGGGGGAPPAPGGLSLPPPLVSQAPPAATDGASGAGAGVYAPELGDADLPYVDMRRADGQITRVPVPQGASRARDEDEASPVAKPQPPAMPGAPPLARPIPLGLGGGMSAGARAQMAALQAASGASSQGVLDALGGAQQGVQTARDASTSQAWGTQGALATLNDQTDEIQQQQQAITRPALDNLAATQAELKAKLDAVKDVDPDHYWNSKSTGEKILQGIGVALGGFAAGMPHSGLGGRNYALEIMNKGIDNDIAAQQANIKRQWDQVSKGQELAKDTFARSTFETDQLDKAKLHAIDKAKNMISGYAAQATDGDAQQKLSALGAQFDAQRNQTVQGMLQSRMAFLQQQAGAGSTVTRANYEKYAKGQLDKGETPISIDSWATQMRGQGGAAGGNPLPGVPERDRGAAREELGKQATYEATIRRLAETGAAATDPNLNVVERARNRDVHNAAVIGAHEALGVPGRTREAIESSAAPLLLSANPLTNDAARLDNIRKLLPRPATPILDAYGVHGARGALPPPSALPAGAVPTRPDAPPSSATPNLGGFLPPFA